MKRLSSDKFLDSDYSLLLYVNNVYLNGFNHKYHPKDFLLNILFQTIRYLNVANENLIIDIYSQPIILDIYGTL
ncbi:MAG: DUF692 family multinuclear iron-containing protein [Flavobacteriales bacterium]